MKKSILFVFVLHGLIFNFNCVAQDQHLIDSLTTKLKSHPDDSVGTKILIRLSACYWGIDLNKAMDYAKQGLNLSEKLAYQNGIADAYNGIGTVIAMQGDYSTSLNYFKNALKIFEAKGRNNGIATSNINIGNIYYLQGNYPEALKHQIEALKANEAIKNKDGIASCYNNIGDIYGKLGNYAAALKNFQAFLIILKEQNDKQGISFAYNNIGETYQNMDMEEEALKNHMASIKIKQEISDKQGLSVSYNNIADIYFHSGNMDNALKMYFDALKITEEIGDKDGTISACTGIGHVYIVQKKYNDARFNFNKALQLSKELNSIENMQSCYNGMAKLDSAQGHFDQALENYKLSIAYRDSMFNEENTKKLVQTQMQYDFDKKEALTKAESEKELEKQKLMRNGFIAGTFLFLMLALAIFIGLKKTWKAKKKSEELLLNILPAEVADELKKTGEAKAKSFTMVTVMFTDFKGFTNVSEKVSAELLVAEIHYCFSAFDKIIQKYKIEKIKTIGDAYLCASGLPVSNYSHAKDMVNAALEIKDFILQRKKEKEEKGELPFEIRIGLHTGPVVAGIVGIKKYAYDIWGDTVNIAARMEQNSEAGKINISGSTYELVKDNFNCVHRGKIDAKNKGMIDMYFVEA